MSNSLPKISADQIQIHFDALSKIGNLGGRLMIGYLRASWSAEETEAMEYIRSRATAYGFESRYDEIGNLFICSNFESDKPILQVGSHLDTVPRGGLFDGGAGIVAGLEAMRAVKSSAGENLDKELELVIWRGEESGTFDLVYKGSKAAFGELDASALERQYEGKTLEQNIIAQGYDPNLIREGRASIPQSKIDRIHCHIELHIEQARKLEIDQDDIGVVTSIRGNQRLKVFLHGEAAHSGATPMGVEYRKDANLALAHVLVRLDVTAAEALASGADLVQTVGVINSDRETNLAFPQVHETGLTKISPFAYFFLDIRSKSKSFLESYLTKIDEVVTVTAKEFATAVEIVPISGATPIESLDIDLQQRIEQAAKALGYSSQRMASGAGHDAAIVSQQQRSDSSGIPTAMIFIPCRDGLSHNPLEFTSSEAVAKGSNVIAQTLAGLLR